MFLIKSATKYAFNSTHNWNYNTPKKNLFSVKSLISYQLKLNCIFVNLNHLEIFHTSENTEKKYFHDCKKVRKMCLQFDYKKLLLSDVRRGERQGILFFFELSYLECFKWVPMNRIWRVYNNVSNLFWKEAIYSVNGNYLTHLFIAMSGDLIVIHSLGD